MSRMLLAISIILALAGKLISTGTPGSDINQELIFKLETMEGKLAAYLQVNQELISQMARHEQINGELIATQARYQKVIDDLTSKLTEVTSVQVVNQQNHQSEIKSLEEERQKQDKEIHNLQMVVEVLQLKLQSTTDECSSMKVQLIKLFSHVSTVKAKQNKKKSTRGNNSTAVDMTEEEHARLSNAGPLSSEENMEAEEFKSEAIQQQSEDEDSPIIATLQLDVTGGVSYIRWGRTFCEGNADALYTGYAGGKYRGSGSAGSELICLHGTPQWGDVVSTYKDQAPVTGVEYYFFDEDPFSRVNVGGLPLKYQNMPCSVCHVQTRSHQLMIPGRKSCPSGWAMEYWGYLVNSVAGIQGGSYVCLDNAPEAATGGAASQPGSQYVFTAESNCVALPCPPYFHGYEIPCVVCSK